MHLPDPTFPPLLKGHGIKAPLSVQCEAVRCAKSAELGAGDVVWARNAGRAELAIILEPEVPLERALQMGPLFTVAVVDALAALCPPKVAIQHLWPGDIVLNNARAGRVQVIAPEGSLAEQPSWLIVSALVHIAPEDERSDWSQTALAEEIGDEVTRTDLVEAIAAHFVKRLHDWSEVGFRQAHGDWLFRSVGRETPAAFASPDGPLEGLVVGLSETAALMLRAGERVANLPFAPHVQWIAGARA